MDWQAIWLSVRLAFFTTLILLACGLPLAYWLTWSPRRWKFLVEALVALPLLLIASEKDGGLQFLLAFLIPLAVAGIVLPLNSAALLNDAASADALKLPSTTTPLA